MSSFQHSTAIVDDGAEIGDGSRVWHFVHVCAGARIGRGVSLGQNVFVGNRVVIGDSCKIQNNVSVYDNVTLEDGVFCGPSMVFTNVHNPRALVERKDEYRDTLVRKGASLGANCTIVCGVTIGSYAFVAAGAVITRDVPDFALMAGVPGAMLLFNVAFVVVFTSLVLQGTTIGLAARRLDVALPEPDDPARVRGGTARVIRHAARTPRTGIGSRCCTQPTNAHPRRGS